MEEALVRPRRAATGTQVRTSLPSLLGPCVRCPRSAYGMRRLLYYKNKGDPSPQGLIDFRAVSIFDIRHLPLFTRLTPH